MQECSTISIKIPLPEGTRRKSPSNRLQELTIQILDCFSPDFIAAAQFFYSFADDLLNMYIEEERFSNSTLDEIRAAWAYDLSQAPRHVFLRSIQSIFDDWALQIDKPESITKFAKEVVASKEICRFILKLKQAAWSKNLALFEKEERHLIEALTLAIPASQKCAEIKITHQEFFDMHSIGEAIYKGWDERLLRILAAKSDICLLEKIKQNIEKLLETPGFIIDELDESEISEGDDEGENPKLSLQNFNFTYGPDAAIKKAEWMRKLLDLLEIEREVEAGPKLYRKLGANGTALRPILQIAAELNIILFDEDSVITLPNR